MSLFTIHRLQNQACPSRSIDNRDEENTHTKKMNPFPTAPSPPKRTVFPTKPPLPKSGQAIRFPEGHGSLLIRRIAAGTQGEMQLVRSLGDGQVYARKRYEPSEHEPVIYSDNLPLEVRISTYTNTIPRTGLRFFNDLVEWADHSEPGKQEGQCALIFRYINGGTYQQLIDDHNAREEPFPEAFIWHTIFEVGSAIAYLHLGYLKDQPLRTDWVQLIHRDLTACNIMLQWPPEEQAGSQRTPYPQPVVCDLGYARSVNDEPGYGMSNGPLAPAQQWEDFMGFGELIYQLCTAGYGLPFPLKGRDVHIRTLDDRNVWSKELIFWALVFQQWHKVDNEHYWTGDQDLVGKLLPLADGRLPRMKASDNMPPLSDQRPGKPDDRPLMLSETHVETGVRQLKPWDVVDVRSRTVSSVVWDTDELARQPEWSQPPKGLRKRKWMHEISSDDTVKEGPVRKRSKRVAQMKATKVQAKGTWETKYGETPKPIRSTSMKVRPTDSRSRSPRG